MENLFRQTKQKTIFNEISKTEIFFIRILFRIAFISNKSYNETDEQFVD